MRSAVNNFSTLYIRPIYVLYVSRLNKIQYDFRWLKTIITWRGLKLILDVDLNVDEIFAILLI